MVGRQAGRCAPQQISGPWPGRSDEGAVRVPQACRNAELALRDDFEAERRQQRVQLLHLLGIVGGEDKLHEGEAALGGVTGGCPGPGPCHQHIHLLRIKVRLGRSLHFDDAAWPVMMTFMSVSQLELFPGSEVEHRAAGEVPTEIAATW